MFFYAAGFGSVQEPEGKMPKGAPVNNKILDAGKKYIDGLAKSGNTKSEIKKN